MFNNFPIPLSHITIVNRTKSIYILSAFAFTGLWMQALTSQSTLEASKVRGEQLFASHCTTCHLANGEGIPGTFPPLAGADYLVDNRKGAIRAVKYGMEGEVTVNGVTYNNIMYSLGLDDQQVMDVMNYILNSWGNEGTEVTLQEVRSVN